MVILTIDNREVKLYNDISNRDLDKYTDKVTIVTKQMDIGDILITDDIITLIFERKTTQDLIASIKDGRYKEQKGRLKSNYDKITYIIEGDNIISSNSREQNILTSSYIHTIYRDNIHIVFTKNVEETATFLLLVISKIIDNPSKFITTQNEEYIDTVKAKSRKCDNMTPKNCYLLQLAQIPNISITIAKKIQEVYPTMRELLSYIEKSDNPIKMLSQIDKIGKEKANKILEYLFIN